MKISFLSCLLIGVPENIGLVYLALAVIGLRAPWNKVIFIGTVLGFTGYLLRLLPITFGVHTIVQILLMFVMLHMLCEVELIQAVIGVLVSIIILVILETVFLTILLPLLKIDALELWDKFYYQFLIFYPHIILLYVFGYYIGKFRGKGC